LLVMNPKPGLLASNFACQKCTIEFFRLLGPQKTLMVVVGSGFACPWMH